jgi:hypothetical protein
MNLVQRDLIAENGISGETGNAAKQAVLLPRYV